MFELLSESVRRQREKGGLDRGDPMTGELNMRARASHFALICVFFLAHFLILSRPSLGEWCVAPPNRITNQIRFWSVGTADQQPIAKDNTTPALLRRGKAFVRGVCLVGVSHLEVSFRTRNHSDFYDSSPLPKANPRSAMARPTLPWLVLLLVLMANFACIKGCEKVYGTQKGLHVHQLACSVFKSQDYALVNVGTLLKARDEQKRLQKKRKRPGDQVGAIGFDVVLRLLIRITFVFVCL